ncbi:hypothetical protein XENOCAPTIV_028198 [Xenoophorus captivus]|uniref:3-beta hydroxysteroid dehydrogenase/isomerase domain-containing protein n=1 Tax=Xenoophorus captivus TaxID=1517983 RepID=A0ABV0R6H5_9TELE
MSENGRNLVYLITGGCGFLGKHLLDVLMEKEEKLAEVRLFDKYIDQRFYEQRSTGNESVAGIHSGSTDVLLLLFFQIAPNPVFFKLRGKMSLSLSFINELCACVECGVEHLVYTSSMEVIGPNLNGDHFKRGNEDTEYEVNHTMAYPKSKAKAEKIVLEANGRTVKGGKCLYTCSLRPTGIYGEGHQLMKDFYNLAAERGGLVIGGVPEHIEHGRVYAGKNGHFQKLKLLFRVE